MVVTFEERDGGTEVTIAFERIPPGIRPEDNDAGTRSSLEKLARYAESSKRADFPVGTESRNGKRPTTDHRSISCTAAGPVWRR